VGELGRAEGTRSPTKTGLVNGLVDDGFARRRPSPADARSVLVEATAKARRVLERGRKHRVAAPDNLLAALRPADIATLDRAAQLIEEAVARRSSPGAGPLGDLSGARTALRRELTVQHGA
jgi:DNA-binding MarR family transcriptional regulator